LFADISGETNRRAKATWDELDITIRGVSNSLISEINMLLTRICIKNKRWHGKL